MTFTISPSNSFQNQHVFEKNDIPSNQTNKTASDFTKQRRPIEFNNFTWAELLAKKNMGTSNDSALEEKAFSYFLEVFNSWTKKEDKQFPQELNEELKTSQDQKEQLVHALAFYLKQSVNKLSSNKPHSLIATTLEVFKLLEKNGLDECLPRLWKALDIPLNACTGAFRAVAHSINLDPSAYKDALALLEWKSYLSLCTQQDPQSQTQVDLIDRNSVLEIQLKMDGAFLYLPFQPLDAFQRFKEIDQTNSDKTLPLVNIGKAFTINSEFTKESYLGRNLSRLKELNFDVEFLSTKLQEFLDSKKIKSSELWSPLAVEGLIASTFVEPTLTSQYTLLPFIEDNFFLWAKETNNKEQLKELLSQTKAISKKTEAHPLNEMLQLVNEENDESLPLTLLWILALAKTGTESNALKAYDLWKQAIDLNALCQNKIFFVKFLKALSAARPDLATKGLVILFTENILSKHEAQALALSIIMSPLSAKFKTEIKEILDLISEELYSDKYSPIELSEEEKRSVEFDRINYWLSKNNLTKVREILEQSFLSEHLNVEKKLLNCIHMFLDLVSQAKSIDSKTYDFTRTLLFERGITFSENPDKGLNLLKDLYMKEKTAESKKIFFDRAFPEVLKMMPTAKLVNMKFWVALMPESLNLAAEKETLFCPSLKKLQDKFVESLTIPKIDYKELYKLLAFYVNNNLIESFSENNSKTYCKIFSSEGVRKILETESVENFLKIFNSCLVLNMFPQVLSVQIEVYFQLISYLLSNKQFKSAMSLFPVFLKAVDKKEEQTSSMEDKKKKNFWNGPKKEEMNKWITEITKRESFLSLPPKSIENYLNLCLRLRLPADKWLQIILSLKDFKEVGLWEAFMKGCNNFDNSSISLQKQTECWEKLLSPQKEEPFLYERHEVLLKNKEKFLKIMRSDLSLEMRNKLYMLYCLGVYIEMRLGKNRMQAFEELNREIISIMKVSKNTNKNKKTSASQPLEELITYEFILESIQICNKLLNSNIDEFSEAILDLNNFFNEKTSSKDSRSGRPWINGISTYLKYALLDLEATRLAHQETSKADDRGVIRAKEVVKESIPRLMETVCSIIKKDNKLFYSNELNELFSYISHEFCSTDDILFLIERFQEQAKELACPFLLTTAVDMSMSMQPIKDRVKRDEIVLKIRDMFVEITNSKEFQEGDSKEQYSIFLHEKLNKYFNFLYKQMPPEEFNACFMKWFATPGKTGKTTIDDGCEPNLKFLKASLNVSKFLKGINDSIFLKSENPSAMTESYFQTTIKECLLANGSIDFNYNAFRTKIEAMKPEATDYLIFFENTYTDKFFRTIHFYRHIVMALKLVIFEDKKVPENNGGMQGQFLNAVTHLDALLHEQSGKITKEAMEKKKEVQELIKGLLDALVCFPITNEKWYAEYQQKMTALLQFVGEKNSDFRDPEYPIIFQHYKDLNFPKLSEKEFLGGVKNCTTLLVDTRGFYNIKCIIDFLNRVNSNSNSNSNADEKDTFLLKAFNIDPVTFVECFQILINGIFNVKDTKENQDILLKYSLKTLSEFLLLMEKNNSKTLEEENSLVEGIFSPMVQYCCKDNNIEKIQQACLLLKTALSQRCFKGNHKVYFDAVNYLVSYFMKNPSLKLLPLIRVLLTIKHNDFTEDDNASRTVNLLNWIAYLKTLANSNNNESEIYEKEVEQILTLARFGNINLQPLRETKMSSELSLT